MSGRVGLEGSAGGRQQIRELLDRVRARWRRLLIFRATVRAGLAASGVLAGAMFLTYWTTRAPLALAALGVAAVLFAAAALAWGFWHVRRRPTDAQVARFIEESEPALDDRLVSAVDLLASGDSETPALAAPMMADAARRCSSVAPSHVLTGDTLRRAGFQAVAAALLLAAVAFLGRDAARQSYDALALTLFPSRLTLDVTPGNARIRPGAPLVIEARLKGNRAPVIARVLRAETGAGGDAAWRAAEMSAGDPGTFKLALESIGTSFKYRVAAGMVTSPVYEVSVTRAPRVTRIEAEYIYPSSLGLDSRTEEDSGDLYAPSGTDVRLRIHTDRAVSEGYLAFGDGQTLSLTPQAGNTLAGGLKILADGSYRVAMADSDGFKNPGDTEYFIRTLEDRPPNVRILTPARDRTATRLEEIDVEAEAEDDFGLDRIDLVYAVGGGAERVVPLPVPRRATSATGRATLYLEDLDVQPGDFVSYYARARDLARGKRSSEARSDIFFLEVKPFEQEFTLAQSQAQAGGGRPLEDLVVAQKEIIVATWKLDRRAQAASGARSEQDIRSVGRAEAELKTRVEQTSSSFRTSTMRDPRGRGVQPGRGGPPPAAAPRAGQATSEEDAMTAAALAMGKAVGALDRLKTGEALQPEMDALNHLLRAQADVKQRQVTRQAGGSGGSNRAGQDLSSLFDRELQRQQQTNYETPTSTEPRQDANRSLLDKIKDLARRQDELLKQQRDLAREQLAPEDMKRALEKLTREQSDLRQRAEDLAKQLGQQNQGSQSSQGSQRSQGSQNSQNSQSSQGSRGAQSSQAGQSGEQMRAASQEMRDAAGDLRRQDPAQASERGARALQRLRDIERQLQASAPDERRRARGDLQLEARQLADRQRQIESELGRLDKGEAGKDALRRLASEEERLAERAKALQQGLSRQAAGNNAGSAAGNDAAQAVAQASLEFGQQRVGDRMQQSAEQMRAAAGQSGQTEPNRDRKALAATQRDLARALDNVADRLAGADGPRDEDSRKLSDQLARAQELRERIEELTRELDELGQRAGESPNASTARGETGRPGQGSPGGGTDASLERLREEYTRKLQETRELLDQLRREDSTLARGGPGFTFEGQGMVLSAPGTEAFKQDFTRWEALRKQATQALEQAESSLSKKLQAKASRDRLAAGVDDKAPARYQDQVDSYFKALATKKQP